MLGRATFQMVIMELRALVPIVLCFAAGILTWFLAYLVAYWQANNRWRLRIRKYLTELTRELLEEKDIEIAELRRENAELCKENEILGVAVRGARAALSLPHEEVRERLKAVRR